MRSYCTVLEEKRNEQIENKNPIGCNNDRDDTYYNVWVSPSLAELAGREVLVATTNYRTYHRSTTYMRACVAGSIAFDVFVYCRHYRYSYPNKTGFLPSMRDKPPTEPCGNGSKSY
jgi:hypothetical protein